MLLFANESSAKAQLENDMASDVANLLTNHFDRNTLSATIPDIFDSLKSPSEKYQIVTNSMVQ